MHLGLRLLWDCEVGPIKHAFASGKVVIDNLEDDIEFADYDFALPTVLSEESQALPDANSMYICQLIH